MIKYLFYFYIACLALCINLCEGATLHTIIVGDTTEGEESYGTECSIDAMQRQMQRVAAYTNLDLNVVVFEGCRTTIKNVSQYFDQMVIGSDDVVVLYFAMHGGRSPEKENRWPDLVFALDQKRYDFDAFTRTFEQKNPRFLLSIADSCNSIMGEHGRLKDKFEDDDDDDEEEGDAEMTLEQFLEDYQTVGPSYNYSIVCSDFDPSYFMADDEYTAKYRTLFLEKMGTVIISASSPGETAWRDADMTGGYLTYYFLESMRMTNDPKISWESIIEITASKVNEEVKLLQKRWDETGHEIVISTETVQFECR